MTFQGPGVLEVTAPRMLQFVVAMLTVLFEAVPTARLMVLPAAVLNVPVPDTPMLEEPVRAEMLPPEARLKVPLATMLRLAPLQSMVLEIFKTELLLTVVLCPGVPSLMGKPMVAPVGAPAAVML